MNKNLIVSSADENYFNLLRELYLLLLFQYLSSNNIRNFKELDIRFNGHGIFKLKGSQVRYHLEPSYTYLKDKKICL